MDSFARTEVSAFSVGHSPRSQGKLILFDFDNATSFVRSLAGQSSSQQRLFTQGKRPLMVCMNFSWSFAFVLDLWFRPGSYRRIRSKQAHDSRSGHAILSSTGVTHGCRALFLCHWHVECRLYICGIIRSKDPLSSVITAETGKCRGFEEIPISIFLFSWISFWTYWAVHRWTRSPRLAPEPNPMSCRRAGVSPKSMHLLRYRNISLRITMLFNCYFECLLGIRENGSVSIKLSVSQTNRRHESHWDQSMHISEHQYIHEGRIRYHSCMCRCCFPTSNGRQYSNHLEPVRGFRYDDSDESFSTLRQGKGKNYRSSMQRSSFDSLEYIHKLLTEFSQANTVPLQLNHDSPIYKTFARYMSLTGFWKIEPHFSPF